ncbi:hypothetical protein FRX31_030551, partial [Thalictrum thalictroides]
MKKKVNKVLEVQHENEDDKLKLQVLQNENAKMNKQLIPLVEVPLLERMDNLQKENDDLKKKVEEVQREEITRPKRKCVKEIKVKNVSENDDFQLSKQKKQRRDK